MLLGVRLMVAESVFVGVRDRDGVDVVVGVLLGVALVVRVNVPVMVMVRVEVSEAVGLTVEDCVKVAVFSTGMKGVNVTVPGASTGTVSVNVFSVVMVGMKVRIGPDSIGRLHPDSRRRKSARVITECLFMLINNMILARSGCLPYRYDSPIIHWYQTGQSLICVDHPSKADAPLGSFCLSPAGLENLPGLVLAPGCESHRVPLGSRYPPASPL